MKPEVKDFIQEKLLRLGLTLVGVILFVIIVVVFSRGESYIHKQNETVKYNDVEYKITNIEKQPYELDEDYYSLKVTIKINNTSKSTIDYSNFNFSIANKDEEDIAKSGVVTDDGTYLKSGSLKPGKSVEGALSWNVKKGAKDLRIRYYDSILTKANEYAFQWEIDN